MRILLRMPLSPLNLEIPFIATGWLQDLGRARPMGQLLHTAKTTGIEEQSLLRAGRCRVKRSYRSQGQLFSDDGTGNLSRRI